MERLLLCRCVKQQDTCSWHCSVLGHAQEQVMVFAYRVQVQNGRIGMLWLHRQLTEEDKDELLHEPLSCFPTPFPRDSLLLADAAQHAAQSAKMVDAVQGWWQAWAAGPNHNGNGSSTSINSSAASSTSNSAASNSTTSSMSSSSTSSRRSRSRNDKAAAAAQLLAPDFRMLVSALLGPGRPNRDISS